MRIRSLMLAVLLLTTAAPPAVADPVRDFYSGKTLTLQVGYAPGGGYDYYARLLARYYTNYLPGNPTVVVQNVPGAGSMRLANLLYNTAPRDGTVIGLVGREQLTAPLYGLPGVQFDPLKVAWVGNLDRAASLCVSWHTFPFTKIEDVKEREMVVGATGPASITTVLPMLFNQVLGYKFKVISGYPGGNDIIVALERGEVQGRCGWSYPSIQNTRPTWLRDNLLRYLTVNSFKRIEELPNVPTALEVVKTDRERQVLGLVIAGEAMARPIVSPPNVPPERLNALRMAFSKMMRDPEFLAQAKKMGLELDPMDWQEMVQLTKDVYSTPPEIVKVVSTIIERNSERKR